MQVLCQPIPFCSCHGVLPDDNDLIRPNLNKLYVEKLHLLLDTDCEQNYVQRLCSPNNKTGRFFMQPDTENLKWNS